MARMMNNLSKAYEICTALVPLKDLTIVDACARRNQHITMRINNIMSIKSAAENFQL